MFLLCSSALFAGQQPDYMGPFLQAQRDLTQILNSVRQDSIEQEKIDVERERLQLEARPANLSYREVHANEAAWRVNLDVKEAIEACHKAHNDCAKLDPLMLVISKTLHPDWTQMTMGEYVECLYAIAKNATFAQQAREMVSGTSHQR